MNKICTSLEQSEKLMELGIDRKTSDMYYWCGEDLRIGGYKAQDEEYDVSAWSLAALLDTIPQEIFDGEYIINITEGCDNKWVITYDHHENRNHSYYGLSSGADNLVDACVDLLTKLKERNII